MVFHGSGEWNINYMICLSFIERCGGGEIGRGLLDYGNDYTWQLETEKGMIGSKIGWIDYVGNLKNVISTFSCFNFNNKKA